VGYNPTPTGPTSLIFQRHLRVLHLPAPACVTHGAFLLTSSVGLTKPQTPRRAPAFGHQAPLSGSGPPLSPTSAFGGTRDHRRESGPRAFGIPSDPPPSHFVGLLWRCSLSFPVVRGGSLRRPHLFLRLVCNDHSEPGKVGGRPEAWEGATAVAAVGSLNHLCRVCHSHASKGGGGKEQRRRRGQRPFRDVEGSRDAWQESLQRPFREGEVVRARGRNPCNARSEMGVGVRARCRRIIATISRKKGGGGQGTMSVAEGTTEVRRPHQIMNRRTYRPQPAATDPRPPS
jgi:hypothetical protein